MVMNMSDLKAEMDKVLLEIDHKNIDLDVSYFNDRPSTVENIAMYLWQELHTHIPILHSIQLHETINNYTKYKGCH